MSFWGISPSSALVRAMLLRALGGWRFSTLASRRRLPSLCRSPGLPPGPHLRGPGPEMLQNKGVVQVPGPSLPGGSGRRREAPSGRPASYNSAPGALYVGLALPPSPSRGPFLLRSLPSACGWGHLGAGGAGDPQCRPGLERPCLLECFTV